MRNRRYEKICLLALLFCALLVVKGEAYTLNPQALEAALWKQNMMAKISYTEDVFKLLITAAATSQDYPSLGDLNRLPIKTSRDKKAFAEVAQKLAPFDASILDDITEILWIVPTKNGLLFCTPEDMADFEPTTAAIVKIKLSGFKDNKFYGLALSGIRQNRIVEEGAVWIMPDISQTQVLIEQTVEIIRSAR